MANTTPHPTLVPAGDVRRDAVEALLASLRDGDPWPAWARQPANETQFAASVVAHGRSLGWPVEAVYDDHDRLIAYAGIRLRDRAVVSAALAVTGGAA
jgi:hypothetical protein